MKTMNVENMLKLADFLESLPAPEHFNMDYWASKFEYFEAESGEQIVSYNCVDTCDVPVSFDIVGECNTAGCIAGWAAVYDAKYNDNWDIKTDECESGLVLIDGLEYEDFAASWLGLNIHDAACLFFPTNRNSVWLKYASEFNYSFIDPSYFSFIEGQNRKYINSAHHGVISKNITNKDAAYMLRSLALGRFNFDDLDRDYDQDPEGDYEGE